MLAQVEGQVVIDLHGIEEGPGLENEGCADCPPGFRVISWLPPEKHLSGVGVFKPDEVPEQESEIAGHWVYKLDVKTGKLELKKFEKNFQMTSLFSMMHFNTEQSRLD